ncbi:MAG TPA: adenylate/guanylate cyclase domain-containing protein [Turneriella sp.]|nr:adenylate/guanylate cyclase domain-containing protein [Turneriella sp.]
MNFYRNYIYPRFSDRRLEHRFILDNNEKAARQARWGFAFGTFGYAMLGAIAFFIDEAMFARTKWLVYGLIMPTHSLAAFGVTYLARFFYLQWVLVFANIFSNTCVIGILYFAPEDFYTKYGYGLVICILIYTFAMLRMRTFFAIVGSSLVIMQYVAFLLLVRPMLLNDAIYGLALISFVNTAGLFSVFFFEQNSRTEFMQSRTIEEQSLLLNEEKKKSEALLLNVLPESVANRLLSGERTIADYFDSVSVLFADIEGFTSLSRRLNPHDLVQMLNRIFSHFDALAGVLGLEKIKTIGDAYMVGAGLPAPVSDHAQRCFDMALGMLRILEDENKELPEPLKLRIGIASGPVVAGVIGQNKFIYDLWGETVNTASRMESSGVAGEIHITASTKEALGDAAEYIDRGEIEIKGIGKMTTYLARPLT